MAPADNVTQTISPSITCLFVSFCRDKVAMVMMESVLMPAPLSENNNDSHPSTFRAGAKHLKFFSRVSHRQPEPAKTTCHLTLTSWDVRRAEAIRGESLKPWSSEETF